MLGIDPQNFLGAERCTPAATAVGLIELGGGSPHVAQQLAHVWICGFVAYHLDQFQPTGRRNLGGCKSGTAESRDRSRVICAITPKARIVLRHPKVAEGRRLAERIVAPSDRLSRRRDKLRTHYPAKA